MSRNPDVQRLLANLRSLSSTPPRENITSVSGCQLRTTINTTPAHGLPASTEYYSPGQSHLALQQRRSEAALITTPVSHSVIAKDTPAISNIPDASTITTWPTALKHVTKYIATNPKAALKIKHLISEQHKHERQWWTARQETVARHASRVGNQQKAADLLKSLGGIAKPVAPVDAHAEKAELDAFDRKVFKGMTEMAADFDRQLRGLGVPFFAIKHDLVILEKGKEKEGIEAGKLRLDKGELRELQKRMIQLLEDLFGDD